MEFGKIINLLILIIFVNLFISCDCLQKCDGIIVDEITKKPIKNAEIKIVGKDFIENSDENVYFEIGNISGGIFSCPDMIVIIAKNEYQTDTIKIKNGENKLVQLLRQK